MKKLPLIMAVCVFGVSMSVMAETTQKDNKGTWLLAKYDNNGDKVISLNEINTKRKEMHSAIDIDEDGQVSFEEYQSVDSVKRTSLLKKQFKNLDVDKNGRLSDQEYSAYQGNFDRFDLNKDGKITRAEMKSAQNSKSSKIKGDDSPEHRCLLWLCVRSNLD